MSFHIDKAFAVSNGLRINESLDGPFITGGPLSPIGLDLLIGTIYFQPKGNGFDLWQKFGAGVNDWEVKEFVAKALITEFFADNGISTTTSDVFQDKINQNTEPLLEGRYLILWSCEYTNNNNNRSSEIKVSINAAEIGLDQAQFSNGGVYKIVSSIFLTDTISGVQNLNIQFRRVDSGTAAIRRATIGYIKVL